MFMSVRSYLHAEKKIILKRAKGHGLILKLLIARSVVEYKPNASTVACTGTYY